MDQYSGVDQAGDGEARPRAPIPSPPNRRVNRTNGFNGDWASWLRMVERSKRQLSRFTIPPALPAQYFAQATLSSFRLDGIELTDREVSNALAVGVHRQSLRSRQSQRIRNHVAVLHSIELNLKRRQPLKSSTVVRWYTSIACGLSTGLLNDGTLDRIDHITRRINSPQLRLQPAMQEIAHTHIQLLNDPLVPSFNGILARLLLRYHLGRCGMPPVMFDPTSDTPRLTDDHMLLTRLMGLITEGFEMLLNRH